MVFGINESWDIKDRRDLGKPLVNELGANCVRANALWGQVQAWGPDHWDWEQLDQMVYDFWNDSQKLFILQAIMAPRWALTPSNQMKWDATPGIVLPPAPINDVHFAEFIRQLANRYGLTAIEVWNEPNIAAFGSIPPRRMGKLVQIARQGLNASTQPGLTLLTPAPYPSIGWEDYLRQLISSAAGSNFSVGCHPYSRNKNWDDAINETLNRFITTKKAVKGRDVWVTEVGFSSGYMGPQAQAKACGKTFEKLRDNGAQAIIWHRLAADSAYHLEDPWEQGLGICTPDWSKKPAFVALQQ